MAPPSLQGRLGKQKSDTAERIAPTGPVVFHFLEMGHGLPKNTWDFFFSQREAIAFGHLSNCIRHT